MRSPHIRFLTGAAVIAGLCACAPSNDDSRDGITMDEAETYAAIGPEEVVNFTGTEPFWGGEAAQGKLRYSTPEDIEGRTVYVDRFAGNNGLLFSGVLGSAQLDLAITPGQCSDGMSERVYPFVATLKLDEDIRHGCAWTQRAPFSGSPTP